MIERMTDCGWFPMMGFGMFFMALFWVMVFIGFVLILKRFLGYNLTKPEDSALEILKKRYARGELNKQEYEECKRDLLS